MAENCRQEAGEHVTPILISALILQETNGPAATLFTPSFEEISMIFCQKQKYKLSNIIQYN